LAEERLSNTNLCSMTEKHVALRRRTLTRSGLRARRIGRAGRAGSGKQNNGGKDGKNALHGETSID
jgi:hypothetical protein